MKDKQKIYFLCPAQKHPTGGVKQIYRQVDILNANGYEAAVVHGKKNFRVNWFVNDTVIKYYPYLFFKINSARKVGLKYTIKNFFKSLFISKKMPEKDAILVFPEIYGKGIGNGNFEYKKVIFNQNCYYTFDSFVKPSDEKNNPYVEENTLGCMVVSEDSKNYLEYAFPNLQIERLFLGIKDAFFIEEGFAKKKQIAYMPRKLGRDLNQVIHLIKNKSFMKDWELVPISGKSEKEVAEILKSSAIYLSTNHIEGFGLPPAEAMASGCYVIGYAGNGGLEYFKEIFCSKIPDGNILLFAREIEKIVTEYDINPTSIIHKGTIASEFVKSIYNLQNEEASVLSAWKNLLK